jgi:hypothetical protein
MNRNSHENVKLTELPSEMWLMELAIPNIQKVSHVPSYSFLVSAPSGKKRHYVGSV